MSLRILRAATLATALVLPAGLAGQAWGRPAPLSFADLASDLLPSVVNISSSQSARQQADRGGPDMPVFPPGSPFEKFFKDFLDRNRPGPNQGPGPGRPPSGRATSLGSGFIVDPSGYIVTNNHVIDGADEITVTLVDKSTLKAKLVGKDERVDLALLKVESDKPLKAVSFGDSDVERVGDWVLAIGNPFGLGGSVTAGIVSARGRDIRQGPYDDFIQTDASINRGNSGGPLFNMNGEVIGINTAIYSPSGGSVGIGFSVPSNLAKNVVAQLREYGRARRGWLGVRIQQVTPDIAESLGLKSAAGALVAGVNDDGPADNAKIQNGDVVLKFDGHDIDEMRALPRIVAETAVGATVPVVVWRNGRDVTLQAKVGELPDEVQQANAGSPAAPTPKNPEISSLGARIAPITDDLRDEYKLRPDQKGVVVTDIDPNGPAGARGLKPGDVIVEVQQEPVSTPDDVASKLDKYRNQNRKTVLMLIQSGEGMRWVPLPLQDDAQRAPG